MIQSPFNNSHKNTIYNKIKIFLFTISGIAIIRLILFLLFGSIACLLFNIFLTGYNSKDANGNFVNISCIRRFFLFIPQILSRIALFILGYYYINDNIPNFFKLNYLERLGAPKLIIANHVSFIDTFYFICRGIPSPVASYNVLNLPIVGFTFKKISPILVPTNEKQKLLLPNPKEQITERLTHPSIELFRRPLIIFPEGSTKNSKYLFKFQNGAFMDKITYQPVLLNYQFEYLDPSWTLDTKDFVLLYLMCCQFYNNLEVTFLEPTNKPADEIRKVFISKLNLFDSNYSNHDNNILKFNENKKDYILNHIFENGLFTMTYYKKCFHINSSNFMYLINTFYKLDDDKVGKVKGKFLYDFSIIITNNGNKNLESDKSYSFYEAIKNSIN
jgi:1-acyl-sn-glycerol-3-phosphate acyltransferase